MYLGRIVERGDPDAIFRAPAHPYARALVSAIPVPGPRHVERIVLQGDPPNPARRPSGCAFHPRCPVAVSMCRVDDPGVESSMPDGRLVACHVAHGDAGGGTLTQPSANGRGLLVSRRVALGVAAAALPRVAIGQAARPVLTVAVAEDREHRHCWTRCGSSRPTRASGISAWCWRRRSCGTSMQTCGASPGLADERGGGWMRGRWRSTLRPGVMMHDGRTMTAEDVAWTFWAADVRGGHAGATRRRWRSGTGRRWSGWRRPGR